MFQRVAIIEAGGAAMRCVRSIGATVAGDTAPAIVLLHRGAAPPASLRAKVDEVVELTPPAGRGDLDPPAALDAATLGTHLERAAVDAVWVGWGAPEEHVMIARACEARGIAFVGPTAAALAASSDPTTLARHLADAARPTATRAPAPPGSAVEVQLLIDRAGTSWTVGTVVHHVGVDGHRVLSWSGQGHLDPEVLTGCERTAVVAAETLGLQGAVAIELTPPTAAAPAAITRVRAHLTPAHLLTELLTGRDLVAMQFELADGALLGPQPIPPSGVAVSTTLRLNERAPACPPTTTVDYLRTPFLPGLRAERPVEEGDEVATALGTELLTLGAVGRDRTQAARRLGDGIEWTRLALGAGATDRAAVRDRLRAWTAGDALSQTPRSGGRQHVEAATRTAIALVMAAIEIHDAATAANRQRFLTSAARGHPLTHAEGFRTVDLQVAGNRYRVRVSCTGPRTYDLSIDDLHHLVATLEHDRGPERWIRIGERRAAILSTLQGTDRLLEVEGQPIRVTAFRDGTLRAPQPAIILRYLVGVGDVVRSGDPVAVLESMKLEIVLSAPFSGRIDELLRATNDQVEAGAGVLRIEPLHVVEERRRPAPRASFAELVTAGAGSNPHDPRVAAARRLHALVLGFDRPTMDPGNLQRSADRDEQAPVTSAAIEAEREVLQAFADLTAVAGRHPHATGGDAPLAQPGSEHLRTYLRTLDADADPLPEGFRTVLLRALRHLGVTALDRTIELDDALYRLHLAQQRAPQQLRAILVLLGRWLDVLEPPEGERADQLRGTLDDLVRAADQRFPEVGDLARRTRYQLFDRARILSQRDLLHRTVHDRLVALTNEPDPDRRAGMASLVDSTEPLLPMLLDGAVHREVLAPMLELLTRRYYRRRGPTVVRRIDGIDVPLVVADLDEPHGREAPERIIAVGGDDLEVLLARAAAVAAPPDEVGLRGTAVDVYLRWPRAPEQRGAMVAALLPHLGAVAVPPELERVTVTTLDPEASQRGVQPIQHLTFRPLPSGWTEDRHLRGIHPLVADRLDLWRFDRFELSRLPSADDVYLFRGTAREDPSDVRLFALAEVRDLTTTADATGVITALPELERVLSACLDDLRRARAALPSRERPVWNRIVLNLWPQIAMPLDQLEAIVHALSPLATGLGLEEVTLLVRTPDDSGTPVRRCLRLTPGSGHGMSLRITNPPRQPLRPMDALTSRVVAARRRGTVHPAELLPWILTPPGAPDDPARRGRFVEYDLDAVGSLRAVDRELGHNTAGIVVGVVTSPTERYPEGMARVALLSDPTHGLGSLAEPECRRIIAALDLAEAMQVPVEWFPVSSGARIAMDSGTENLDWTARVLRRIVRFTQAGGEINIVVAGINVGAQPYWNALSTMLMHTSGILVMTPDGAMVLTGKRALQHSGGVAAEDDIALGGYERVMGPNGEAQYWAPDLKAACALLFRHHDLTYVAPGERAPRRLATSDPSGRDVRGHPHRPVDSDFTTVGDVFSADTNPDRKKPFDIRSVLHAVVDQDRPPLERWPDMAAAETAVVFHAQLGGRPVVLLGVESRSLPRREPAPADGPQQWSGGTLFPRSSRKMARAINAASGRRPLVVLANLSGFDGSPESMRERQLEYGAEIGRAVVNFRGPMVFCVISRYHGGAFVVFAKTLNPGLEVVALEGAHASVIGGAPAAAVVFTREVDRRTMRDPRVVAARERLDRSPASDAAGHRVELNRTIAAVRSQMLGAVAGEFDRIHDIDRAVAVGSVDRVLTAAQLRPYLIDAIERGLAASP